MNWTVAAGWTAPLHARDVRELALLPSDLGCAADTLGPPPDAQLLDCVAGHRRDFALCNQSASKILDEVVDKYAHFWGHLPAAGPDDVKSAATGEV